MRFGVWMLAGLLASGCVVQEETSADGGAGSATDEDGDGYPANRDCDDSDPAINPGADEILSAMVSVGWKCPASRHRSVWLAAA